MVLSLPSRVNPTIAGVISNPTKFITLIKVGIEIDNDIDTVETLEDGYGEDDSDY